MKKLVGHDWFGEMELLASASRIPPSVETSAIAMLSRSAAAKRHGFVATDHRVETVGLCADCR